MYSGIFQEYSTLVEKMQKEHPEYRKGQTFFNALYEFRPKLADKFRTSDIDPFFDDKKIPAFLYYIYNAADFR